MNTAIHLHDWAYKCGYWYCRGCGILACSRSTVYVPCVLCGSDARGKLICFACEHVASSIRAAARYLEYVN